MSTTYVMLWWNAKDPHRAEFLRREAAEAAAHVRNGVLLTLRDGRIVEAFDYWRRDAEGHPMPFFVTELLDHPPGCRPAAPKSSVPVDDG